MRPGSRARDRVLPPAVPPDTRERCVVGSGVHRMDKRRAGATPVPRPPATESPGRARVLRSAAARDACGPGRPDRVSRHRGLLLLALLVRGEAPARTTFHGGPCERRTATAVLPRVGERELVGAVEGRAEPDSPRADLPGASRL